MLALFLAQLVGKSTCTCYCTGHVTCAQVGAARTPGRLKTFEMHIRLRWQLR